MSIASQQDILEALSLTTMTAQAQKAWTFAETAVKEFLHWNEVEQNNWYEYFTITESFQVTNDPQYIQSSNNKSAVPGWYLAPNVIQLRQIPVRQILAVYEDPTAYFGQYFGQTAPGTTYGFPTSTLLDSGIDYFLKEENPAPYGGLPISFTGQLERRGWWFPAIPGSILVYYTSGFSAAELSNRWQVFKDAVLETAQAKYLRYKAVSLGQLPDIASEGLGGGATAAYRSNWEYGEAIPDRACDLLNRYVFMGQHSL